MQNHIQYIFRQILKYKSEATALALLIIVECAMRLSIPYLYKIAIDKVGLGDNFSVIAYIIGIIFVLAIFGNIARAYMLHASWAMGNKISRKIHLDLFKKLLDLDYQIHSKLGSSKLGKIADNAESASWELTNWWTSAFVPAGLGFICMTIIAININIKMTIASLIFIPVHIFFIKNMFIKTQKKQDEQDKLWNKQFEKMQDTVSNIVSYKFNQNKDLFTFRQAELTDATLSSQLHLNKKWRLVEMLNPDAFVRIFVLSIGLLLMAKGEIGFGTLIMFLGLLNEILVPLHILGEKLPNYSKRAKQLNRGIELLNKEIFIKDPENPLKFNAQQINGKIEFKNVSYSYEASNKYALKNINFTINANEKIALVGHSGSGKSTIIALITRLIDPDKGEILLDGVNIKNYKQEDYRSIIGVVQQENILYQESIEKNIEYGSLGATFSKILQASKIAQVHEFVSKLPNKYKTEVGERGIRLSGGEKQRIAIARAIIKNPKIVILDEPTSALDSITEEKVQAGIENLIASRSSLTIAHRLSTVQSSDKIIVLEKGQIIDIGSHNELVKTCPNYKQMVDLQTKGFLPE